jgi:hypothetical protein
MSNQEKGWMKEFRKFMNGEHSQLSCLENELVIKFIKDVESSAVRRTYLDAAKEVRGVFENYGSPDLGEVERILNGKFEGEKVWVQNIRDEIASLLEQKGNKQ